MFPHPGQRSWGMWKSWSRARSWGNVREEYSRWKGPLRTTGGRWTGEQRSLSCRRVEGPALPPSLVGPAPALLSSIRPRPWETQSLGPSTTSEEPRLPHCGASKSSLRPQLSVENQHRPCPFPPLSLLPASHALRTRSPPSHPCTAHPAFERCGKSEAVV